MPDYIPGEEIRYDEGAVTFMMNLVCKCDRLWFSNGLSFPLNFRGLVQTGKMKNKISLGKSLWDYFVYIGLVGNLDNRNPGDIIWIYSSGLLEAELDYLIVKDSDRKMFITAKGRIVSFKNDLYLWTGYSVSVDQIMVSDEARRLLHQFYP